MATKQPTGVVVQAWVPPSLRDQLKREADSERRSVSSLVRNAVEDRLAVKKQQH